jgi:TPR repeat protein
MRTRWTEGERTELLTKAQRRDADSQMWLAAAYEQGRFGERNFSEAAQNALGQMYEDGEGVKQNYVIAAKRYKRAAEYVPDLAAAGQGRNNLGLLYLDGRGVSKDYVEAYMWFSLVGGEPNQNVAYAKEHMTQQQIFVAEHKVKEGKIRHHARQD